MENQQAEDNHKYDWLIIFIIYADHRKDSQKVTGEEASEIEKMVARINETLLSIKINDNHKITLIHNSITESEDITFIRELKENEADDEINILVDIETPFRERNILQKSQGLADKTKHIKNSFKHEKCCVITCDHGSIFGINKTPVSPNALEVELSETSIRDYASYSDGELANAKAALHFKKFGKVPFEVLTTEELAEAIQFGLEKPVDILIMFNCCMQNIMTQYALRNWVNILIAPQTSIAFPGYNFEFIFNEMFTHEDISVELMINNVFASFRQHNRFYLDPVLQKKIEGWAIFAFRLDFFSPGFISTFNSLCDELTNNVLKISDELLDLGVNLFPFDSTTSSSILFDLKAICSKLKLHLEHGEDKNLTRLQTCITELESKLPIKKPDWSFEGNKIFENGFQEFEGNPPASGIGIVFPDSSRNFATNPNFLFFSSSDENGVQRSSFLDTRNFHWLTFLKSYIPFLPQEGPDLESLKNIS